MPQDDTSTLSIVDSSGRQVSILNHHGDVSSSLSPPQTYHIQSDEGMMDDDSATTNTIKRKYACSASGCFKSFTTSGHLARHNKIHTGEKNYPCLFPGCQSRFSRQDNMMQHYRTHMSPKSRRTSKKQLSQQQQSQQQHRQQQHSPYDPSQPRLHAHHRIHSDVTAPLSIDQHLRNYHQSRLYPHHPHHHQRHLSTTSSRSSSSSTPSSPILLPTNGMDSPGTGSYSPSSSTNRRQSIRHNENQSTVPESHVHRNSYSESNNSTANMFYQHRPLSYTEGEDTHPTTLLNPTPIKKINKAPPQPSSSSSAASSSQSDSDVSSNSLIQLANIVSSFG